MSPLHWVLEQACGNEAGGVGHIDHEQGAHLVGNLTHTLVVPFTAVGRAAADNQLGLIFDCQLLHLVVVHTTSLLIQIITYGLVENTRGVDERTV